MDGEREREEETIMRGSERGEGGTNTDFTFFSFLFLMQ